MAFITYIWDNSEGKFYMLQGGFLVGFMRDFVSSFPLAFWLLQFFVQILDILKKKPKDQT